MTWKTLGAIPPQDLVEPRLELHHAAQVVAIGVARSLIPARDDDSHTTLTWRAESGQWLCEPLPGSGQRAGLRPADLNLTLADKEFPLLGKTRGEGLDWLRQGLVELGHDGDAIELNFHYEMPDHPIADGALFDSAKKPGLEELARYYGNATELLSEVVAQGPESPEIFTWPHHFDHACLFELGKGRSIGVGLSPGDRYYDQPYLYVTPYPAPPAGDLPALPHGSWRREEFFGAILTAEQWLSGSDKEQAQRAGDFLATAIASGRNFLADTPSER